MSKVIFFGLPAHGHVNPSLPLVRALVGRGEEVVYYANDSFARRIRDAGAEYRAYRDEFLSTFDNIPGRLAQLPYLLMNATRELLRDELGRLREDRPAYVIQNSMAPWGKCVAEILRLPLVTSIGTLAFNWRVIKLSLEAGAASESSAPLGSRLSYIAKALRVRSEVRRLYRIRGPQLLDLYMTGRSSLNIVYTSRYFHPCGETFDDSYKFVGPDVSTRPERVAFPWDELSHETVVYISLGTLYNDARDFYEGCFKALAGMNCHVVLSVGETVKASDFASVPANFTVRSYVPQLEVLKRASLFITRGGMNSVNESLSHQVPLVVVPHLSEQAVIADRVVQLGAGLRLRPEQSNADGIREAVRKVLADDSFRRRSREIAETFRTAGGAREAVNQIFAFTGRPREVLL